jgi:hypothetical protein
MCEGSAVDPFKGDDRRVRDEMERTQPKGRPSGEMVSMVAGRWEMK